MLVGENAQDAGGPYRDTFVGYMREVQSGMLDILVPTPNASAMVGDERDKWLPNPDATSPLQLGLLEFLGKLMGVAMRTKDLIPLNFPKIVWKKLCSEKVTLSDLEEIDYLTVKTLREMKDPELYVDLSLIVLPGVE